MSFLRNAPFHKFFLIFLIACVLIVSGGEFAFAWVNPVRSPTDSNAELGPLTGTTAGGNKVGVGQNNPAAPLHLSGGSFLQDKASYWGKELNAVNGTNPNLYSFQPQQAKAIAVQGNYAYLLTSYASGAYPGESEFFVIDVSNPTVPTLVGSRQLNIVPPVSLVVSGRYAYITHRGDQGSSSYQGTLLVVDLSNPANPTPVATRNNETCMWPNGEANSRAADAIPIGGYLYSITHKISILDNSTPANLLPTRSFVGDCVDLAISAGYSIADAFLAYPFLYVVTPPPYLTIWGYPPAELRIVDVSDPLHPRLMNRFVNPPLYFPGIATKIFVSGKYAYILLVQINNQYPGQGLPEVRRDYSFRIVDISNPDSPQAVGYASPLLDSPGIPKAIFVAGRYAYVGFVDNYGGGFMEVFDVSNPSNVRSVGRANTGIPFGVADIAVSGRYAYLAIDGCGILCRNTDIFRVVDLSGLESSSDATLNSVETGALQVVNDVVVNNNLVVAGEAFVGGTAGGAGVVSQLKGDVSVSGDMKIVGNITKSSGTFEIDHPLDPQNKILRHSFVESPDMKNIYDGTVLLDENGEAVVELPDYFEVLNRDYRYKVTSIGRPAPELYIKSEVRDNQFVIGGGLPGLKVSWQVTGTRKDPFAEAHPIVVEEEKKASDGGTVGVAPFLRFFSEMASKFLLSP